MPSLPAPGFYPSDVSNPNNGKVLESTKFHNVYVDCLTGCWGHPSKLLGNLFKSNLIHVIDRYVGSTADGRYTLGPSASISYPIFTTLTDNDVLQILHAAAAAIGTGYGHVFHIYLPPGVDFCFFGTTLCYSPDNPATFAFCAFHGSVTFSDIGHVLFSLEPFQDVPQCSVAQPSPNGVLIDSTSNVLSHETMEVISDPDGTAWFAQTGLIVFHAEIGDLCEDTTFAYGNTSINGVEYEVQPEYSNKFHGCAFVP